MDTELPFRGQFLLFGAEFHLLTLCGDKLKGVCLSGRRGGANGGLDMGNCCIERDASAALLPAVPAFTKSTQSFWGEVRSSLNFLPKIVQAYNFLNCAVMSELETMMQRPREDCDPALRFTSPGSLPAIGL